MTYPKPIMTLQELKKMGFPEKWLMRLYRVKNNGLAWKAGNHRNNKILFDVERLERIRVAECVADIPC